MKKPSMTSSVLLKGSGLVIFVLALGVLLFSYGIHPALSSADPVQVPTPKPDMSQSIVEKDLLTARMEAAAASGKEAPARKDAFTVPPLPPSISPAFQEGILTGEPGPFYSGEVVVNNLWQTKEAGRFIQVFAGADGTDPSQGLVILLITQPDRRESETFWFPTPEKAGSVTVLNRQGSVLQLESLNGDVYYFDYFQMEFVGGP